VNNGDAIVAERTRANTRGEAIVADLARETNAGGAAIVADLARANNDCLRRCFSLLRSGTDVALVGDEGESGKSFVWVGSRWSWGSGEMIVTGEAKETGDAKDVDLRFMLMLSLLSMECLRLVEGPA